MDQKSIIAGLTAGLLVGIGGSALFNAVYTGVTQPVIQLQRFNIFPVGTDGAYAYEVCAAAYASPDASEPLRSKCTSFTNPLPPATLNRARIEWSHAIDDAGVLGIPVIFRANLFACSGCDAGYGYEVCGIASDASACASQDLAGTGAPTQTLAGIELQYGIQSWVLDAVDGGIIQLSGDASLLPPDASFIDFSDAGPDGGAAG